MLNIIHIYCVFKVYIQSILYLFYAYIKNNTGKYHIAREFFIINIHIYVFEEAEIN